MTTPIYGSTSCSTLASDDSSLENSKPKHSELAYNYRKGKSHADTQAHAFFLLARV